MASKQNIELIKYADRGYLSSVYVDNRYLLAEDLNKDNGFLLENNSKTVKAIYGTGEVLLYNPKCFDFTDNICNIKDLNIFVDGFPVLLNDIAVSGDGVVNLIVGVKELNMSDKIYKNGRVKLQGIDYTGVTIIEEELENDIILKDPVFAESWTSNRQQLQYTVYIGEALETKTEEKDGETIKGIDIGGTGSITNPNFYCLPLFTKKGNVINFDVSNFNVQSDFGVKSPIFILLKDLNKEFINGYTDKNTLNVPKGLKNGIRSVNKYPTLSGEKILDKIYDTDINIEYYRTIGNIDDTPTFTSWERRLTTADIIKQSEVLSFLDELYGQDVILYVGNVYNITLKPVKFYPINKNGVTEITLDFDPPTLENYEFDSWNTDPYGGGTSYSKNSVISVRDALKLYAIYRKV